MADAVFDAVERAQLVDLLDGLGPDAPTLLAPWTTRDLAAHLVLREHDHLAGPGLVLPGAWARLAERRRRTLASSDFSGLVATIRAGPPPGFFRIEWVRRFPNLNEFFVHHEDVRRADGRGPRTHEHAMDDALWRNVSQGCRFLARRLRGAGLTLQRAGTADTVRARRRGTRRPYRRPSGRAAALPLRATGCGAGRGGRACGGARRGATRTRRHVTGVRRTHVV